jgi:hypothetical protein
VRDDFVPREGLGEAVVNESAVSLLARAFDPDGRPIELTRERWEHIVGDGPTGTGHPELRECRAAVIRAVESPTTRLPGLGPGEEWFYLEGAGPSRYLKVVVAFTQGRGRIVTAFARRALP